LLLLLLLSSSSSSSSSSLLLWSWTFFFSVILFLIRRIIPQPPVPPSVLSQPDVTGQIQEMREYFRAWTKQNKTHRDYQNYFKPVCSELSIIYVPNSWVGYPVVLKF
jgi:hypothetical protein